MTNNLPGAFKTTKTQPGSVKMMNRLCVNLCRFMAIGLFVAAGCVVAGCAHESGRKKPEREPARKERREAKPEPQSATTARHTGEGESFDAPTLPSGKRSGKTLTGAEIFSRYNPAVFMVFTTDGYHQFQGSGFFINSEGVAVSNYHVFKDTMIGAEQLKLAGRDKAHKVTEVLYRSAEQDVIVFRVNVAGSSFIPLATQQPAVGERVYALGSPQGLENTFSSGEISQWRSSSIMQISVPIDHGSSGGALINEYGQAVGITSGGMESSGANLNYAISTDVVRQALR